MNLSLLRWILLGWSILGFLSGTILDSVMMRFIVTPWLRSSERVAGRPLNPPRVLAVMLERRWMRGVYHLVFAALLLAGWWYLGTPEGAQWAETAMAKR
jgi:hypothetical protein